MDQQQAAGTRTVGVATDATAAAWDAFVAAQPGGSFYHRYGWKTLNERHFGHATFFLEAREGPTLTGVLPLVLTRSRVFGRILCSMPFVNYGGPLAADEATAQRLIEAAQEHAARLKADYLELRCAAALDTSMSVALHKISMSIDLQSDPEQLWNGFSPKHRKNVRRAYKDRLSVSCGGAELLDPFYLVLQHSWRDLGTPLYDRGYFAAVLEAFPESTRVFVCRQDDEAVAVALVGYHRDVVEGMWAGATKAGHALDANYVLYWEMIKDACERGYQRFHLGRSTAGSGAEQFKKKWNAIPKQLYWYYHYPRGNETPIVNVNHPVFHYAISTWRRLPLWATSRLGPPIARVIP
jgi:FemAB-related protein (PEP-CTERM system-associated)